MLEAVHIAANKNTVPGDVSAMVPGGIRMGKGFSSFWFFLYPHPPFSPLSFQFLVFLSCGSFANSGTPALTSRGFLEEDFAKVADFFDAAVKLAVKIKGEAKGS